MRVNSLPLASWLAVLAAALGTGCGRYRVCDEDDDVQAALPRHLSETGLYADGASGDLAAGVIPYTPRFALWSDGSDKRRWVRLPPGEPIDTSNMDDWSFPEGTQFWKEFSVGGVRVETRLLEKRGPGDADWLALSYVWDADTADATAAPLGVMDSHGSAHDVPAATECVACHGGRKSFVLGFSAVQLAQPAREGELNLDDLVQAGQLSQAPDAVPVIPGNQVEVAALGYLHANCSHCHNQTRPERRGARCFNPEDDLDFTLTVDDLEDTESTPTYRTVVGEAVKRGKPEDSRLFELVKARGFFRQMPPLATEQVDREAVANLRVWIEGL